jgi:hypothetical protein
MHRPLLFAFLAACGNAVFVYAQRGASPSSNPFLFMMYVVVAGAVLFSIAAGLWGLDGSLDYVAANARHILLGGAGFFTTYVGFYLLFSGYGASQYTLYATLSILTTSRRGRPALPGAHEHLASGGDRHGDRVHRAVDIRPEPRIWLSAWRHRSANVAGGRREETLA